MQGGNRYYQLQVALKMLEKYTVYTGTHCCGTLLLKPR